MRHRIEFSKLSGAGNDFVLIDLMRKSLAVDPAGLARALCSRPFGIGADGLLLLEPSQRADFAMRYFNADGSYGGMCGNGGRCIAMAAHVRGYAGTTMRFEALDHIYAAEVVNDQIRLNMKDPAHVRFPLQVTLADRSFSGGFVDTGSPHAVLLANDLQELDLPTVGRQVRYHPLFAPAGANANFLKMSSEGQLLLRTYERGVEAETYACGTGSVATAVIATRMGLVEPPVKVHVRSGEVLTVDFQGQRGGGRECNVILQGSAYILFHGIVLVDDASYKMYPVEP